MRQNSLFILFLGSVFFTTACSRAETLSKLVPPAVDVSAVEATWDNGVRQLVKERCASCHAAALGEFVPDSTPLLDFTLEDEFRSVRGRSLARIEDAANPMPPNYSDPLSQEEKEFLRKYLSR